MRFAIILLALGQAYQAQPDDPAFHLRMQMRQAALAEDNADHTLYHQPRLLPVKPQIPLPDLAHVSKGTQAGQGQVRVAARDDDQVERAGWMPQQAFQQPVDLRSLGAMIVVENQDEAPLDGLKVVGEAISRNRWRRQLRGLRQLVRATTGLGRMGGVSEGHGNSNRIRGIGVGRRLHRLCAECVACSQAMEVIVFRAHGPNQRSLEEATPTLDLLNGRIGFFGHTHREQVFFHEEPDRALPECLDERRYLLPEDTSIAITAGATGQPRDGDPRARWLSWDTDTRVLEFHRVDYDNQAAAAAILAAGLPERSALRLLR